MNSSVQVHPRVIQVIQRQITDLVKRPPDSIQYILNESDILDIQADIFGPVGTPYTGGVFRCKLVLSNEFPKIPPKGFFLTKIFHPNVSEKGEICVNTLKKDWDPSNWSLQHILEIIRCLLIVPFPESALNEEAGKVFMEDYDEYAKHARLITQLYATPKDKINVGPVCSPTEQSKGMDISFENTQDSPVKLFPTPVTPFTFNPDSQLIKENVTEPAFGSNFKAGERQEEVLMQVTNSLNNNNLNLFEDGMLKKNGGLSMGGMSGIGMGIPVITNPANNVAGVAAKKEDDKKKWRKRI